MVATKDDATSSPPLSETTIKDEPNFYPSSAFVKKVVTTEECTRPDNKPVAEIMVCCQGFGFVSWIQNFKGRVDGKIDGNATLFHTSDSIMVALQTVYLGDQIMSCISTPQCGVCMTCCALPQSITKQHVKGGTITCFDIGKDIEVIKVSGRAVEFAKIHGDMRFVVETLTLPVEKSSDLSADIKAETAILAALIAPQNKGIDKARVISCTKKLVGMLESHVGLSQPKVDKSSGFGDNNSGFEKQDNEKAQSVAEPCQFAGLTNNDQEKISCMISGSPIRSRGCQSVDVEKPDHVVITILDEEKSQDQASELNIVETDEAKLQPKRDVPVKHDVKETIVVSRSDYTVVDTIDLDEEGCGDCEAIIQKICEEKSEALRPFVKYEWELKRLAEQWIFNLDDVARLTDDDWNVLTLSPATTLSLHRQALGRVMATDLVITNKAEQVKDPINESEDSTVCVKSRVLQPEPFTRLSICVNVDFAPTTIVLCEGFLIQPGYSYNLMFGNTVLCKSTGDAFILDKSNIWGGGRALMEAAEWDLRNFVNDDLWIDSPGTLICKAADNGRFYFPKYAIQFRDSAYRLEKRWFEVHRFCKFDLGHFDTISMHFSHPTQVLSWDNYDNTVNLLRDFDDEAQDFTLFNLRKEGSSSCTNVVPAESPLAKISLPHLGKVWALIRYQFDMLPENYTCTQVYMDLC